MEYLKSTKQIEDEIRNDNELINGVLFPDYDDLDCRCPICLHDYLYKDWWCCKECSKRLSVPEFIEQLVKVFG